MRQLTHTENSSLGSRLSEEQVRQQALREMDPDLQDSLKAASTETRFANYFWKYGFLAIILSLLAINVMLLLRWQNFAANKTLNVNLVVALMLLFNHIAFNFTKTGWKSRVMKTVAFVWIVFGLVYVFWALT